MEGAQFRCGVFRLCHSGCHPLRYMKVPGPDNVGQVVSRLREKPALLQVERDFSFVE